MSIPASTHYSRSAGFSLVELVITILLIGILSTVLLINVTAKAQHSVSVQADQFRRNLSHLQLLAISQSARLRLTVTSGNYSVCLASLNASCTMGNAIFDPATGNKFSVDLTDPVTFTQGTNDYYFDTLGRPVLAGSSLKTDTSSFTLSGGGRSVNVSVTPITGFAQTAYS